MTAPVKAIVAHGPRDLRLEDRPAPDRALSAGEVAIDIATGGICGSDLHYYLHGGFGTVRLKEPMILGHEVAGRITALGDGVSGLTVGQLVAVSPSRPCGACKYCLEGLANQCLNMRFYGSAMPMPHIQGAFRGALIARAEQCIPADGLTPGQAAMAEPLAVCLHAVRQAGPMLGKRLLVIGAGPIGVLSILAARRAGATEIVAIDLSDFALSKAAAAGADLCLNTRTNPDALTPYLADKGHFDVLLECSGAQVALAAAIPAVRPHGVIVQVGMGGDMTLPVQAITAKELTFRGTFRFHEEFRVAVEMMQKGLIDVAPLITHTFSLSRALEAFDLAADKTQAMKVQIDFTA